MASPKSPFAFNFLLAISRIASSSFLKTPSTLPLGKVHLLKTLKTRPSFTLPFSSI
ncbi:hypothetical protein LDC_1918 [sediment metagenome]|uniref:Uncharacterized protein n=1 Tax=sediment metagenome TaxID=749907 RepID=D9PK53_9ZZZZ